MFVPVVFRVARRDLAGPVIGKAHALQLLAHRGDVFRGPHRGMDAAGDRRVLGRQAERVPPHRVQHVVALRPAVARDEIAHRVVAHVADMQLPRRVGKHLQHVIFRPGRIVPRLEGAAFAPALLPLRFALAEIVARHAVSRGGTSGAPAYCSERIRAMWICRARSRISFSRLEAMSAATGRPATGRSPRGSAAPPSRRSDRSAAPCLDERGDAQPVGGLVLWRIPVGDREPGHRVDRPHLDKSQRVDRRHPRRTGLDGRGRSWDRPPSRRFFGDAEGWSRSSLRIVHLALRAQPRYLLLRPEAAGQPPRSSCANAPRGRCSRWSERGPTAKACGATATAQAVIQCRHHAILCGKQPRAEGRGGGQVLLQEWSRYGSRSRSPGQPCLGPGPESTTPRGAAGRAASAVALVAGQQDAAGLRAVRGALSAAGRAPACSARIGCRRRSMQVSGALLRRISRSRVAPDWAFADQQGAQQAVAHFDVIETVDRQRHSP